MMKISKNIIMLSHLVIVRLLDLSINWSLKGKLKKKSSIFLLV